jgi:signal transduction histidine kinase
LLLGLLAFVVFAIVLFRLQSANSRIKELMKHRDQFYTIVAHDLRGPINTLSEIGNVIHFLVKQNRTADLAEVTNRIDTVSAETSLLLNNLIEWGKSSNYKVATKQQVFDATQVIKELYDSHKTLAEAKGIDMTIEMPERLEIAADPKSLSLILRNLLDNARKFTPNGKSIKIFVEKLTNQVSIHVKDSGQGIPPEQLNYIQEVFAGKIKPEVGEHGLGLGIILIHDFAHKNNMTLNVTSEVGVGTCFSLVVNA